jgi:hypothetical protein
METMRLTEDERQMLKLRALAEGYCTFPGLVKRLKETETSDDAKVILLARRLRPDLFHDWSEQGRPAA